MARFSSWSNAVPSRVRGFGLFGIVVLALALGGFGVWAATAPLAGAAIAPAVIAASGENRVVQHLEGGIIRKVLVREGEKVEAGQPLIVLDPTQTRATARRVLKRRNALRAIEARLVADATRAETISFPADLVQSVENEPELSIVIDTQIAEFEASRERDRQEREILQQRILAIDEQIVGLKAQKQSAEDQLDLIREEVADVKSLYDKGLARKERFLALRRAETDLVGQVGNFQAEIGRARQTILEAREQILLISARRVQEASSQLSQTRAEIDDLEERLIQARDQLRRTVIKAPVSGLIVNMAKKTVSGVVAPGEELLQILPTDDLLVARAFVAPRDVDIIKIGQHANLHLTALNARITPVVAGTVIYVSADRLTNERTGEPYYQVLIELSEEFPDGLSPASITPGMPVEAFITTAERTFLSYLVRPITDSMNRAFREQ